MLGTGILGICGTIVWVDALSYSPISAASFVTGYGERVINGIAQTSSGAVLYAAGEAEEASGDEEKKDEKKEEKEPEGIDRIWSVVQFASLGSMHRAVNRL